MIVSAVGGELVGKGNSSLGATSPGMAGRAGPAAGSAVGRWMQWLLAATVLSFDTGKF